METALEVCKADVRDFVTEKQAKTVEAVNTAVRLVEDVKELQAQMTRLRERGGLPG
jgi:hypothetical protein